MKFIMNIDYLEKFKYFINNNDLFFALIGAIFILKKFAYPYVKAYIIERNDDIIFQVQNLEGKLQKILDQQKIEQLCYEDALMQKKHWEKQAQLIFEKHLKEFKLQNERKMKILETKKEILVKNMNKQQQKQRLNILFKMLEVSLKKQANFVDLEKFVD